MNQIFSSLQFTMESGEHTEWNIYKGSDRRWPKVHKMNMPGNASIPAYALICLTMVVYASICLNMTKYVSLGLLADVSLGLLAEWRPSC